MADDQEFMQDARKYIGRTLRLDPMQWQYNGIVPLKDAENLMDVIETLNHESPNARIQAARILRLYEGGSVDYVLESLRNRLNDKARNEVGSFQCEEDEVVYVRDEIKKTIDALKGL